LAQVLIHDSARAIKESFKVVDRMLNDCYIDKYQYTVVRNQTLTGAKVSPPWSPLNLGFSTGSRCHCRSTFSRCDGYRTHFSGGIGP